MKGSHGRGAGKPDTLANAIAGVAPLPPFDRCNTDGVSTDIYFAGENVRVRVDEDPSQVAEAFASAGGLPFRLSAQGHREVYINPAMVAFWSASESSPELGTAQDSSPPATGRQSVTDIWGNPLRKKPRR